MAARWENTAGRKENAMSDKSFMHGHGESYNGIVPTKQPNKGGGDPRRRLRREGR